MDILHIRRTNSTQPALITILSARYSISCALFGRVWFEIPAKSVSKWA